MNKYAILTVIYHETPAHFNMALRTWKSFPEDAEIIAVINKRLDGVEYPDFITYLENDENCLARAWNMGLKYLFNKGYENVFVSGLDSESPNVDDLDVLAGAATDDGFSAATPLGMQSLGVANQLPVKHGDGSFSFFCINKDCFELVGDFDEGFKPAYFEDNDYLERMWQEGLRPVRRQDVQYFHIFQGTVKNGEDIKREYPVFMQKNLEYFREKWGFTPPHLPSDIKFS